MKRRMTTMNSYLVTNLTDSSKLSDNDENIARGLLSVITCDIGNNCEGICKYTSSKAHTFEFNLEVEDVMYYLKHSKSFNLLSDTSAMDYICKYCPDFRLEENENCYAFRTTSDNYEYCIHCDNKNKVACVYVYSLNK